MDNVGSSLQVLLRATLESEEGSTWPYVFNRSLPQSVLPSTEVLLVPVAVLLDFSSGCVGLQITVSFTPFLTSLGQLFACDVSRTLLAEGFLHCCSLSSVAQPRFLCGAFSVLAEFNQSLFDLIFNNFS